ncbi:MAG: hypothetical protein E7638_01015 [Ruminococcaceae bacterium]|nr:hypothetical protein [Oscillospiraceae bacterium]
MKTKIYIAICTIFAMLVLTSCEAAELWDFILPLPPVEMPLHIDPAEAAADDEGIYGVLAQHLHRETLRDPKPDGVPPTAKGYVELPFLPGMTRSAAEQFLSDVGLTCIVEESANPSPAGVVYAVDYAGVGADGMHYINPQMPVTLCVSADKPDYPESTVENTIYLTFDDGPDENTVEILDILDTYGIKGTFFLLGDSVKKYPDAAKAIYERGHDAACHSMSHRYEHIYASADNLIREVDEWVGLMESLGVDFSKVPKLFRYPGGSSGQYFSESRLAVMNDRLAARGFRVYDWNIVANDALLFQCPEGVSAYEYIKNTFEETLEKKKNSSSPKILLLHETVGETRVVLPHIIEYLIENGYTFAPISSLHDGWTFADEK